MMKEGGCIKLANQINLQKVGACKRPEMDWTVLNTENVYQFVIQHEIAHVRRGDPMFYFEAQIRADFWTCGAPNGRGRSVAPKYKGIAAALEADADRAAWTALWPGKTMPKRPDMAMPPELLDDILERFKDDREKYQRCSIKSISTDPRLYVPYNHVKEGIPWALPVAAMPDFVPEF